MSAGCDGPFRVRVVVPADPGIVRVVVPGPMGPMGPPGPAGGGGSGADPQLTYSIAGASSFTANHGRNYRPAVALLLPSGEQVETDVYHAPGQVTVVFAQPFTGTLLLG